MHDNLKDVRSLLVLLSALVLGQSVLGFSTMIRVDGLADRVDGFGDVIGTQLGGIESFIKYTTDGVWVGLEGDDGPALGSATPTVEIVEFADFECPACRAVSQPLLSFVRDHASEVRLVVQHAPLALIHPHAVAAALGGICADRAGKFWPYYEMMYGEQTALTTDGERFIIAAGTRLGLDPEEFRRCMEDAATRRKLDEDMLAASRLVVRATPTFFINGKRMEGSGWEFIEAAIQFELRTGRRHAQDEPVRAEAAALGRRAAATTN